MAVSDHYLEEKCDSCGRLLLVAVDHNNVFMSDCSENDDLVFIHAIGTYRCYECVYKSIEKSLEKTTAYIKQKGERTCDSEQ